MRVREPRTEAALSGTSPGAPDARPSGETSGSEDVDDVVAVVSVDANVEIELRGLEVDVGLDSELRLEC
jgi:hypothetical protein